MNDLHLIQEATKFTVIGMSTVFVFLMLLIMILQLQASLLKRFFPPASHTAPPKPLEKGSAEVTEDTRKEREIVAAITAAITHYKKR